MNGLEKLWLKRGCLPRLVVAFPTQLDCRAAKEFGILTYRTCGHIFQELRSDQVFHVKILPRIDTFDQIVAPCFEMIDPAFHRISIASDTLDREFSPPSVIANRLHG